MSALVGYSLYQRKRQWQLTSTWLKLRQWQLTSTWLNLTKNSDRDTYVFLGIICTAVSYDIFTSKLELLSCLTIVNTFFWRNIINCQAEKREQTRLPPIWFELELGQTNIIGNFCLCTWFLVFTDMGSHVKRKIIDCLKFKLFNWKHYCDYD